MFKDMAEECTLIDSGATENFIDHDTVKRLCLGTKQMEKPAYVKNIDGTNNCSGRINRYIDLLISRGNKKIS
jgi:hypothetical protein